MKLNRKWCAGLSVLKYFVLAAVAVLCFLGIYPRLRGTSPWDVFSMLPVLPVFSLRRNREECAPKCSACTGRCPSDIELPQDGSYETPGDCFGCQKCVDICPKQNIHCQGGEGLRGNEIWFTVIRVGIFSAMCMWIGI